MSSDVAAVLGAAFGAAILASIGSYGVARFAANRDAEQRKLDREEARVEARRADERNLRDAKRERLRRDYEAVAFAAT
jgi:hypothetical protein